MRTSILEIDRYDADLLQAAFEASGDASLDGASNKSEIFEVVGDLVECFKSYFQSNSFPLLVVRGLPDIPDPNFTNWLSNLVGDTVTYDGEGEKVMELRPDEASDMDRPAFNNRLLFPLHTDMSYVPNPPNYFLLRVAEKEPNIGGTSMFSEASQIVRGLSVKSREILTREKFNFDPPPHYSGLPNKPAPILELVDGEYHVRFRMDALDRGNAVVSNALDEFVDVANACIYRRIFELGELCVVDNRKLLHGRTAVARGAIRNIHRVYLKGGKP